ncbi:MAG: hypothetical protein IT378_23190 [Sandaracinaceae bacterium]|nr:hypothetical protein [Sandaracinaceae bacterium]
MRSSTWNGALLVVGLVLAGAMFHAPRAEAQCMAGPTCNTVSATAKGAIGGGILGAEIGFMIPALIVYAGARELDQWWSWVLFPTLGAVGGSILGYFTMEDPANGMVGGVVQRGFPEVAVAFLAISMALIVPTFVGVLALTSYNPGADSSSGGGEEDEGASEGAGDSDAGGEEPASSEPATEPSEPPPSEQAPATEGAQSALQRTLAGGPGLLRFAEGAVLLGVPMVHSADTFTAEERSRLQLGMASDVRIPLVSGTF